MECQICHNIIALGLFTVELSADEDGVEVGCTCPSCSSELFTVVRPTDFQLVD